MAVTEPVAVTELPAAAWRARRAAHEARVDVWVQPHLDRRRRGQAHAVEDFLFTYYGHRPSALRRWHPGEAVTLVGARPEELGRDHVAVAGGAGLDAGAAVTRRRRALGWVASLLRATAGRSPQLGCFGLHEWAMVYREADGRRHGALALRLGPAGTEAVVDALELRCTHVDAVRFFTPEALPRNRYAAPRERQLELEQPGCLHATMDLYKWAYKLGPLVPAELVADAFELARCARLLDMAAGPYDLAELGVRPVAVETAAGRREYASRQRDVAARAALVRSRLLDVAEGWLRREPGTPG